MNDNDELPILEDDEDDNEETNNGPILPVFSNIHDDPFGDKISNPERGRARHHHTPIDQLVGSSTRVSERKMTSQERNNMIQKEIEGDFDKEFYEKPIYKPKSKIDPFREVPTGTSELDSSEGETTDNDEDEIIAGATSAVNDSDFDKNGSTEYESYPMENLSNAGMGSSNSNYHTGDNYNDLSTQQLHEILKKNGSDYVADLLKAGSGGMNPQSKYDQQFNYRIPDEENLLEHGYPITDAKQLVCQHVATSSSNRASRQNNSSDDDLMLPIQFQEFDEIQNHSDDELSLPSKVRAGVTSGILKLYNPLPSSASLYSDTDDRGYSSDTSITSNFKSKIKFKPVHHRNASSSEQNLLSPKNSRDSVISNARPPMHRRSLSANSIANFFHPKDIRKTQRSSSMNSLELPKFEKKNMPKHKSKSKKTHLKLKNAARITVHIADVLQRQRFILTLCKALMMYGAPNHRLEEYLGNTAKVLEIDASFIYLPGCMIVSFGDPATRTSEVKLVRVSQGLDLGKLDETHDLYKRVVHDKLGVEQASTELEALLNRKPYIANYWMVLVYGLCSAFVIIWFGGSWLDMVPSFVLGCLLGALQLYVAPKSQIYSSIFEVTSSIWLSFFGRAIGSIKNGKYFCYGAITQSGLCMLLPGYLILSGALEIQSKSFISGSVRMVYAIIYSLFLGFGLTLGAALYGWMDSNATTATQCTSDLSPYWNMLFIPVFTLNLALSSQAQWHQIPIMVIIGCIIQNVWLL
ncbi:unnamed protein product [Ambrosiozyma monospora]|uniref:Unnamed protein product n=1 Tax=Ambrosiozyma monospora TaxID=43982 RepID=A0ACB5T8Z0_AMBMO|nr:unnamed protein product [Ambrosiozyma monospora]